MRTKDTQDPRATQPTGFQVALNPRFPRRRTEIITVDPVGNQTVRRELLRHVYDHHRKEAREYSNELIGTRKI